MTNQLDTGPDALHALAALRTPTLSLTKRFLEQWHADTRTQRALVEGLRASAVDLSSDVADVDIDQLRYLWDPDYREAATDAGRPLSPLVEEYLTFRLAKLTFARHVRDESAPTHAAFRAWRLRQIQRVSLELPTGLQEAIVHPAFTCELSDGCSVGCWFCGVSAAKFRGYLSYTSETAALWTETLLALRSITGTTCGRWGFLYWATDPFDNPDYERFCEAFSDVFGQFPHTTTAKALANPSRTRQFLAASQQHGCFHNRFSILSLGMMRRLHGEFTADELALVELVTHNKEAELPKLMTGRARERHLASPQSASSTTTPLNPGTIACVSGFLFNMVRRTVQLISPCVASARWPQGYRIHEEQVFRDGADVAPLLTAMIERNMPEAPPPSSPLSFRPELTYRRLDDGFELSSPHGQAAFQGLRDLALLGDCIREGRWTAERLVTHLAQVCALPPEITQSWIGRVFAEGVLEDEPVPEMAR